VKRLSRTWRSRRRAQLLGRHGVAILAETKNGILAVDATDFHIARQLLVNGEYGMAEIQFVASLMPQNATLIFVGAHIGSVLVPLAKLCKAGNILAFEPNLKTYYLLGLNLRLNGLERVQRHPCAIGSGEQGILSFIENPINTGNSRVAREGGEGTVSVTARRLDSLLPETWNPVDLVVIDVEGFECEVMRGAGETLKRTRYCLIEFAPEQLHEQGETVEAFAQLCAQHFSSGYAFGRDGCARIDTDLAGWITRYPRKPGLLLNLLLARENLAGHVASAERK
jgi:FkbM family methyltransferase